MKIFIAIAALLLAAVIYGFTRSSSGQRNSFWDVLRNPGSMPDLERMHAEVDEAATLLSGSPADIAALVDSFVFKTASDYSAWTKERVLAKLGTEAYPRALEILRDSSLTKKLTTMSTGEFHLPEGPINRLCKIVDQDAPPPVEAANLLSPFIESEQNEIRKSVALILGSIGASDSIPQLRQALSDPDEYVQSYALMGIQRAISGDRIESSSKDDFFKLVSDMWPDNTSFSPASDVAAVLLGLDRDRAVKYLLSDELFTVHFEPSWRILQTFSEESVEVPRSKLLTLINDANQDPLEHPMGNVLQYALPLLGAHRNDEDLAMFEQFLDHEEQDVVQGASEAMYRFYQYSELIRDPWDVVENHGWGALTAAEKHICAIDTLDGEVSNGGFAQYYFNSSSNHWQDAQAGLEAIGAGRRLRVLNATLERFGDSGPSVDRDVRTNQLAKLVRAQEDPFREQCDAWYEIKDEVLAQLKLKYNLANMQGREKSQQSDEAESGPQ
ncbi:DMP19 family protein [Fuerstiella marisgermanici]|uniref:DNA mimic protein DMP19 C-terminal domain-containing protein n=1 Tax=Fuerstiella marisgermanici TaxID=1891926 RepID=A0A1P8WGA9_9PLAN|nr:DUF4375 domain-containing protein [Fuerstiella marisgermanici]APZ93080.1 hypothetical protein Fuma_02696 [Fuerstiella marisgermanici]